ncbi:hypothetical protein BRC91_09920 [Halobacteriales archaeon QS_4_62_28]|nr:MAG: hypothetical protein BRC91_09920 [Halobacteriales archaeon QS_4_62_28]
MVRVRRRRGQLVLVAAVVIAVALIPMVLAYLQLGYHADVRAGSDTVDPTADATGTLTRALHSVAASVPAEYDWSRRSDAIDTVRSDLAPRIETIERARIEAGTARSITYNRTRAQRWMNGDCPDGPGRAFGPCRATRGIVVQERDNRTQVLGIAVDIRVTSDRGRTTATVLVPTTAGQSVVTT